MLRKLPIDLSAVPDDWNAPPQILGEAQGVRVEILRQRDGCWCFSAATVARVPEMFDKLAGKTRAEQGRGSNLDSARDLVMTFQDAAGRRDFTLAARCLNLGEIHVSAADVLGPVLAFKLKYVLDRIGRIYVQEIPDNPEGPRYVLYRGELGRVVVDRKTSDPGKGLWQFTPETVQHIEPMFRAVLGKPLDASQKDGVGVLAGAALRRDAGHLATAAAAGLASDRTWDHWISTSGWGSRWRPLPAEPGRPHDAGGRLPARRPVVAPQRLGTLG